MEKACAPFCSVGEMFGLDHLKKLKPSFGVGSSDSNEDKKDAETKFSKTQESEEVDDESYPKEPAEPKRDNEESGDGSSGDKDEVKEVVSSSKGDTDEDEEDVQEMLDNIRISDFNLSVDFDEIAKEEAQAEAYDDRIQREEIYSKRYHPSKTEKEELQQLATDLGESSSSFRLTSSASALEELLFGNHSIILKKGVVSSKDENCFLYILTDGFILVYQQTSVFNPLGSRYEACNLWRDVDYVDIARAGTLLIQMQSGESYELHATADGEGVRQWFQCIEPVVLQYMLRDKNQSERIQEFGWQYTVMRKPGFTAAVTGDMRLMGNPRDLNYLDVYNKSTALHYAMQREPCNAEMVDALLRLGADPNFPDSEGRSAMYFAKRNELDDIASILEEHGGKSSKLAEMELRGELFGGVEQAQRNTVKRREDEKAIKDQKAAEASAKAESAQSQMSKNMAAMIERGEKIEEMDDKARQINEQAKEYGNFASQLKNQMKNKKWYQL
ncbi:MAG: hypothetical protein SGILL_005578 [Bacillariaceae sp.]